MKPIADVYPDYAKEERDLGTFYGPSEYGPLLESLGNVVLRIDDDDYQGDSRVLFSDGQRYGHLQFGWGSCSGCDALQACETMAEIDDLRASLARSVIWFDTATAALDWFNSHDWEGDYSWHNAEQRKYIEQARDLLYKALPTPL